MARLTESNSLPQSVIIAFNYVVLDPLLSNFLAYRLYLSCYGSSLDESTNKRKGKRPPINLVTSFERPTLFTILHFKKVKILNHQNRTKKQQKGCKTRLKTTCNENAVKKMRGGWRKTEKTIEMDDKYKCLYCIKDLYCFANLVAPSKLWIDW